MSEFENKLAELDGLLEKVGEISRYMRYSAEDQIVASHESWLASDARGMHLSMSDPHYDGREAHVNVMFGNELKTFYLLEVVEREFGPNSRSGEDSMYFKEWAEIFERCSKIALAAYERKLEEEGKEV